jgi:ferritin-like metal-binding protein YciE
MVNRAKQLFEHELKDMYDAEHRFVDALQTMIERTHDTELADGFHRHQLVTRGQIRRLEHCFEEMKATPKREHCAGADGIVKEYQTFVKKQKPDAQTLDVFTAGTALKAEHYEIAAYQSMVDLARRLDMNRCAALLSENLEEEEQSAAEFELHAHRLGATLTDTHLGLRDTASVIRTTARTGGLAAVGRAVRDQATETFEDVFERAGEAVSSLEERGRRARQTRSKGTTGSKSRTRPTSRSRSRSTASRTKGTRSRSTTGSRGRTTESRRKAVSRTSPARRTTARRSATRTRARASTRKPAATKRKSRA